MKDQKPFIQPYQESWVADFSTIKEVLSHQLQGLAIAIEHVGSTSVPGLAAKPIIDIDLIHKPNDFAKVNDGLTQLGYFHNGNQGIKDREAFKRDNSLSPHPTLDSIKHHLYVCPDFSQEFKRHLLFRDYLRKEAATRKEYESLKLQIAEEANQDRKVYATLKEEKARDFVEMVIGKALEGMEL